jgi:TPP-dependent 2-oxoacid decarboxylase
LAAEKQYPKVLASCAPPGVAGAFAERVPVVVITGSSGTITFRARPLLHHTLGDYQKEKP